MAFLFNLPLHKLQSYPLTSLKLKNKSSIFSKKKKNRFLGTETNYQWLIFKLSEDSKAACFDQT